MVGIGRGIKDRGCDGQGFTAQFSFKLPIKRIAHIQNLQ